MKKTLIAAIVALGFIAVPAMADDGFYPAYVIRANVSDETMLAQDFSEQEAQLWVLNAGYNQVSGLTREGRYLYRGTALLDGATYEIVVDAQGNILGAKE